MHQIFNLLSTHNPSIYKNPLWGYAHDGLKRNIAQVKEYYRLNPTAVESNHFLVRLLQSITVPHALSLDNYYDSVDTIALNLSMALGMTSSIYSGKVFDAVFYASGNKEILLASDAIFDYKKAHEDWQNISAIQVLRQPMTDLQLGIPDGKMKSREIGLSVIAVNIPMLAVQYRAFRQNEDTIFETLQDSERSIMQFIRMYVLPNMLDTHVDQVLFNRIANLQQNKSNQQGQRSHSFVMPDYTSRVDVVYQSILNNLEKTSQDFWGIMKNIPVVNKPNMELAMYLPQIAPTRNCLWALSIARIPVIKFLFLASINNPNTRNQQEVDQIRRAVLSYQSGSVMRSMLPNELFIEVQKDIDTILNLC